MSSAIHYSPAVGKAVTLIEQIGTLPVNKMKCQAMLEEQRRQVEKAYKYQTGKYAIKQLKAESSAFLIEQSGNPKANKLKGSHSMTAEKRDLEEQRRLRGRAYKF